jgi:hypothetical protein
VITRVAVNAEALLAGMERRMYARSPEKIATFDAALKNSDMEQVNQEREIELSLQANEGNVSRMSAYPNPSNGKITIAYLTSDHATLEVVNALGAKVKTLTISEAAGTVELSDLNAGIYYIMLQNNGKIQVQQKIVVIK